MQAKGMFLENHKYFYIYFIIFFFVFFNQAFGNTNDKLKVLNYLSSFKNFSASFLQSDGQELSEGKFYIGNKRVRAEYIMPNKILIILDEDKAMYYNYELEESEFFNPKNTNAWFFYEIFSNPFFLESSSLIEKNNELILEKSGVDEENKYYLIRIHLENKPLILRKIEVFIDKEFLQLSIFNHKYEEIFDEDFFALSVVIQIYKKPFF